MFEAPISFVEAESMLKARLDTPTALKHVEIAETWDADFRQRAFFSARVTDAAILSELHDKVQAVVDGRMSNKQARALLREYFAGPGADALGRMGFAPERDARTLGELSSIPRLDLIIETNVRMAQEVGHYQSWAEHADYFRYGVWRCGWAKEHREEHLARDGKVYRFDHPIWTQSPPGGEFNCKCYREIASDEDIERLGLKPEDAGAPFEPSSLGFDPSRAMRDPPPFGKRVRPEYQERAQRRSDEAVEPVVAPEVTPAAAPVPAQDSAPVAVPSTIQRVTPVNTQSALPNQAAAAISTPTPASSRVAKDAAGIPPTVAHCEVTIRRPNGDIETVVLPPEKFPALNEVLFEKMRKANRAAGRGEVLSYLNVHAAGPAAAVAPKASIELSTRGMSEYPALAWIGDISRPDADILAECRRLLALGRDVDDRDQSDADILAKIAAARRALAEAPARKAAAEKAAAEYDAKMAKMNRIMRG